MVGLDWRECLQQLRLTLAQRGESSIAGLSRAFRIADIDNNHCLSYEEFEQVLAKCGYFLGQHDLSRILKHFDTNRDRTISYDEFLVNLHGNMGDRRKLLVMKAYRVLDKSGDGVLTIDDLRGVYCARKHPKVLSGEITSDQALQIFLDSFEGSQGNRDKKVTLDEFVKYYQGISASIPYDDNYFCQMMEHVWGFNEDDAMPTDARTAAQRIEELEHCLREKIRQKTYGNETGACTLRRALKNFDLNGYGYLNATEFIKAMERFGFLGEAPILFDFHTTGSVGKLDYVKFATELFAA